MFNNSILITLPDIIFSKDYRHKPLHSNQQSCCHHHTTPARFSFHLVLKKKQKRQKLSSPVCPPTLHHNSFPFLLCYPIFTFIPLSNLSPPSKPRPTTPFNLRNLDEKRCVFQNSHLSVTQYVTPCLLS